MESYMIWQLSLFVGFLLALVVVILIAVAIMIGVHFLTRLDADITREILESEKYREVMTDDRED